MSKFVHIVCCTECDWMGRGISGGADNSMFLLYDNICPQCGLISSRFDLNFYQKVMRRVSTSVWWNPLTWGEYRLEEKKLDT